MDLLINDGMCDVYFVIDEFFIDVCEIYIVVVVLVGDWVFKVKKFVVMDFCDFCMVEQCECVCIWEFELNSWLVVQSYLGIVYFSDLSGGYVELVVVMWCYCDKQWLVLMVIVGLLVEGVLDVIVEVLVWFYQCVQCNWCIDI